MMGILFTKKAEFIQSIINQSSFYSTNIPGEAKLSGATAESVQQQNQRNSPITSMGHWACRSLWGKGQVKEICLRTFLKGSN